MVHKTVCRNGHELTEENRFEVNHKDGVRFGCRECQRIARYQYLARRKRKVEIVKNHRR
jgi:RNase P subunit RPR2